MKRILVLVQLICCWAWFKLRLRLRTKGEQQQTSTTTKNFWRLLAIAGIQPLLCRLHLVKKCHDISSIIKCRDFSQYVFTLHALENSKFVGIDFFSFSVDLISSFSSIIVKFLAQKVRIFFLWCGAAPTCGFVCTYVRTLSVCV